MTGSLIMPGAGTSALTVPSLADRDQLASVVARVLDGAASACRQAGSSYGRFMQVEQHVTLRTSPYTVMVDAVSAAFP